MTNTHADPALATDGLSKRYRSGAPLALDDVTLTVPTGSITAVVGPNGAGKSTLIRTWMGFERPTAGRVAVTGIDPWRHRPEAVARIGYVPQAASLYRDLTVADHLALAVTLRHGFERSVAVERLKSLGIGPSKRASELSGGQQAQLGLAIALATRAPVLLLDEPLASLDPLARREFLSVLVAAVRADGHTAFLSSHIVTDVEEACERLVVLSAGRVLLDAEVAQARADYRIVPSGAGSPLAGEVATFAGPAAARLTLVRTADPSVGRAASLEDIVLGYLSSARASSGDAAAWVA
ncbi:MAG TPA: ABC transporter ATP-binding protein [Candidatus Sulfotelmatobacter sp.]|nr:ABC transporter ATP-binding protein [Candidatus Sulfotelmatobacter sp.]